MHHPRMKADRDESREGHTPRLRAATGGDVVLIALGQGCHLDEGHDADFAKADAGTFPGQWVAVTQEPDTLSFTLTLPVSDLDHTGQVGDPLFSLLGGLSLQVGRVIATCTGQGIDALDTLAADLVGRQHDDFRRRARRRDWLSQSNDRRRNLRGTGHASLLEGACTGAQASGEMLQMVFRGRTPRRGASKRLVSEWWSTTESVDYQPPTRGFPERSVGISALDKPSSCCR